MSGQYEILCLENPLLDIQAVGDEKLLQKYGLKSNDAILAEEKHMGLYEDLFQNYKVDLNAGGAAQNTARGAQYILPADSVVFVGCVGKDKYAEKLVEANQKVGLRAVYRYDDEQPTGRCGVIITGHDRSMCTDLAAANCYKVEHLKENWDLVKQAKIYFVGGYHLTVSVPAIMALAEEAAAENKVFMLSLSAPFIPQFFKDQLDQTSPYWDYVVGNETEARSFAASHDLNTEDITTIVKQAKIYFVGGYHLTVSVPAIMALAEEAAAENKVFMLSLSAPFIPQFFKDQLDQTSPYWDYVVGNETEARSFAASHDLNTEDIPTIAKHMANLPKKNTQRKRTVIITQGTEPTVVAVQGEDNVKTFPVHVISKDEIADTTGAGDAFAGGFLAGMAKGESIEKCVDMGSWLAKLSIKELGPAYPFPKQTYSA
ncbi:Ribokinase-like protein, partial [Aureobasidium melanogenum]